MKTHTTPRTIHSIHLALGALCALMLACGNTNQCKDGACQFTPGGEGDPVLKMAQAVSGTVSVQVTISNVSNYPMAEGVVSVNSLYTRDQQASNALKTYLSGTPGTAGAAQALIAGSGQQIGINAFLMPSVPAGQKATIVITVPDGSKVNYLARVISTASGTGTDMVVNEGAMSYPNGSSGTFLSGFSLSSAGNVVRGNNSVGAVTNIAAINVGLSVSNCNAGANSPMKLPARLISENFSAGANEYLWPFNIGWDGDFNAEWVTDGVAARPLNPMWPSAHDDAPVLPLITGFVKFLDVCPTSQATLSVSADVVTDQYTSPFSDTTLVIYFFDSNGGLISVSTNYTLLAGNARKTAIYDLDLPQHTRRIGIVPMALLTADEQQTVYYKSLTVDYEPKNTYSTNSIGSDNFSKVASGGRQPDGWTEYGGDWFIPSGTQFVTAWNPSFGGTALAQSTEVGLYKSFSLPTLQASSVLTASVFASATFTSRDSFVMLRAQFLNASGTVIGVVDSDRLKMLGYGNLDLRRVAIPTGAKSVRMVMVSILGAGETSSFLADNLSVSVQTK